MYRPVASAVRYGKLRSRKIPRKKRYVVMMYICLWGISNLWRSKSWSSAYGYVGGCGRDGGKELKKRSQTVSFDAFPTIHRFGMRADGVGCSPYSPFCSVTCLRQWTRFREKERRTIFLLRIFSNAVFVHLSNNRMSQQQQLCAVKKAKL